MKAIHPARKTPLAEVAPALRFELEAGARQSAHTEILDKAQAAIPVTRFKASAPAEAASAPAETPPPVPAP